MKALAGLRLFACCLALLALPPLVAAQQDASAAAKVCLVAGAPAPDKDSAQAIAPVERDLFTFNTDRVLDAAATCLLASKAPQTPELAAAREVVQGALVMLVFGVKAPGAPEDRLKAAWSGVGKDNRFEKMLNAYYLGAAFEYGMGVAANPDAAAHWYRQAAAAGSRTAARELQRLGNR